MSEIRELVVVSENTDAMHALYVDGRLTLSNDTIYACDIVEASEGKPVIIKQEPVDLPEEMEWPATLQQLREMQEVKPSIGQQIVDAIISGKMVRAECPDSPKSSCLLTWSANVYEQIDQLIAQQRSET